MMRYPHPAWLVPVILASACGRPEKPRENESGAPPVAVKTVAVAAEAWPALYEATGTVRARVTASISSKTMGYVQSVHVQQGDHVVQGQTLVTLDARDLDTSVRRAEAGVAEARNAILEADSAIAAAQANLNLAAITFKRMQDLDAKNSITKQEFDEASAKWKTAQAQHDLALARRAQAMARIQQADQERNAASIVRSYSVMAAPFAGTVVTRSVEPGNLAVPGTPLLTIERTGEYRLEAAVEESRLALVKLGSLAAFTIDSTGCNGNGRVAEVVPAVDPASRSYLVKIDVSSCTGLRTGMFGRAAFAGGDRKVIAIPSEALIERGQVQSVLVAEDGFARARLVAAGARKERAIEILSGLSEGDPLIFPVPAGLRDGGRIEASR